MTKTNTRHAYLVALLLTLLLASCASPSAWAPPTVTAPPPTVAPTAAPVPASPTPIPASPTTAPTTVPAPSVDALVAAVQAKLPTKAFEGVKALPLTVLTGSRPLWAVYSFGMRNFDLKPLPNHFVAIYAQEGGAWKELARLEFASNDPQSAAPDYVGKNGLAQVQIEPSRVWLTLDGGMGAHGGVFNLLSFDGSSLRADVTASAASPGLGRIQDVNGDGVPDAVLDISDRYVFCYACGVAQIQYKVYAWDKSNGRMVEREIQPMLMGQSGHPGRALTNEAVSLAEAGLWKDAVTKITAAKQASVGVKPPFSNDTVDWDYGLIKLHADAMAQAAGGQSGYPLLSNVFYGDYPAAVDLMRAYGPAQIFSAKTPLVIGTIAEQWVPQLTTYITASVNSALGLQPALAPAYFLRGWALYLAAPAKNAALAKADVNKAAALAPGDTLFKQSAQFLAGGSPTPVPVTNVTRIQFATGATSANVEGHIAAGDIDRYVLRASKGQWTQVSVSAPKGDLALEIYGITDGQPLVRSQMKRSSWAGVLPATQDYSISVVSFGGNAPYTLQVIIPERITFAPGAISATASGTLAERQTHDYLLRAMAGQTMTVTITSPHSDVLLEIYGITDGSPLVRVPMGVSTWKGKLPGTQDYAIKAVSVGAATSFKIEFVVK
ncbi:MAG: hypothetical protein NT169_00670 [Chloroflexi bacterium]|nr:hypothetical protein [Chloroflexota bacterium]